MTDKYDTLDDMEFVDEAKIDSPQNREIEKSIPKQYEGKNVDELIDMHVNLEKVMRRQGTELGQLRSTVDKLIKPTEAPKPKDPIKSTDLFEDPQKALDTAINTSDLATEVSELRKEIRDTTIRRGQKEFESKYPDYATDVDNPDFQAWVGKNKGRVAMLMSLHRNYDFDSGEALWDMWEEHRTVAAKPEKAKPVVRQTGGVRQAAVEGNKNRPVFSRVKLAKLQEAADAGDAAALLKWNDPEFQKARYDAYADGRVR